MAFASYGQTQNELKTLFKCTLIKTEWADGDSFQIKAPGEDPITIRLYGADCIELHVSDETDARRLRGQRRYFGITDAAPKTVDSIELAKGFGKAAAEKTADLLKKPFTIHTYLRKALGDGTHLRYYAFIECADGTDLASELVKAGLARTFGVFADGPGDRTAKEYEKTLNDLEFQAAKRGLGAWSVTNWDRLPIERKTQREDDNESELSIDNNKLKPGETIDINKAARDELIKLPGVGEEIANRIMGRQNYKNAEDLLEVEGIGPKKLNAMRPFLKFGPP
jgi:competence protein ComEA